MYFYHNGNKVIQVKNFNDKHWNLIVISRENLSYALW